ncbi:MAG TPA: 4'-phosphopantetheinyl transferase superfamily protein [Kofleriaceae bacterium]|nr:4'-phosphopantetheinyl transferase superfamily protein [Kofleriaceae bacterium]
MTAAPPSGWRTPPAELALAPGDAHVWRLPLAQPPAPLAVLARTLDPDEQARARRFHFERDRIAYTAARGALRTLAGRYLGVPPGELVFAYQAKGKPHLDPAASDLCFNVSHSGNFALLAFTRGSEIGVDVERRRPLDDLLSLARISFSAAEYATLCGLPPGHQTDAFFACWSRKEAFIKTTGEGVSQLADFDVSLRPGEPARLLRVKDEPAPPRRWSMHELPEIAGHAAALVVERPEIQIACWDWPPAAWPSR